MLKFWVNYFNASESLDFYVEKAKRAEEGKLDMIFFSRCKPYRTALFEYV